MYFTCNHTVKTTGAHMPVPVETCPKRKEALILQTFSRVYFSAWFMVCPQKFTFVCMVAADDSISPKELEWRPLD